MSEYVDYVDMRLNAPDLKAWDGKASTKVELGEHTFEVTKAVSTTTPNGKPQLSLRLKVVSEGENQGREIAVGYMIDAENDGARGRMLHLINVLGVTPDEDGRFLPQALVGLRMIAEVWDKPYNSPDKNNPAVSITKQFRTIRGERPVEAPIATAAKTVTAPAAVVQRKPAPAANGTTVRK